MNTNLNKHNDKIHQNYVYRDKNHTKKIIMSTNIDLRYLMSLLHSPIEREKYSLTKKM